MAASAVCRAIRISARAGLGSAWLGLSLACTAIPAAAGDVADQAAQAETLLESGDAAAAFGALNEAVDAFWQMAPLVVENAHFVDGKTSNPMNASFRPGDQVAVSVEPLGYSFGRSGAEFIVSLSTGIEIRTPGGLILAKTDDFGRLEWAGPVRNRAFTGRIGVGLPDLKAGDYEMLLTIRDRTSQKSASVTLPFSIATP